MHSRLCGTIKAKTYVHETLTCPLLNTIHYNRSTKSKKQNCSPNAKELSQVKNKFQQKSKNDEDTTKHTWRGGRGNLPCKNED